MVLFFIIILIIWLTFLSLAGFVVAKKKYRKPWGCFYLAFVIEFVLSIPAGIYQAIAGWPGITMSGPVLERLVIPFFGSIFNTGGFSIRLFFESTVEPLEWIVGHRSATVLSNLDYYLFLLLIQTVFIAFLVGTRWYKTKKFFDPIAIIVLLLVLVNSLFNVRWFWAGT